MEKPILELISSIDHLETNELLSMKDSLSDFFKDWVNATHDAGHLRRDIHEAHTYHFSAIRDILNDIYKFKIDSN